MQQNKEGYNLLFILPLRNQTTLLGYTNERIEVLDLPIAKYFANKGAIKQTGYKAAMYFDGMYLYPTTGLQNPNCCWIHMAVMCGKDVLQYSKLLQKYVNTITIEQIAQMQVRLFRRQGR